MEKNIYESGEDYLEAILMISERKDAVHSIDVAQELGYSKASVSIAMKKLREKGYITMEKDGSLILLPKGRKIAETIYERHRVLTEYFIQLGVDPETAQKDACKIEHDLSEVTYQKMKEQLKSGQ